MGANLLAGEHFGPDLLLGYCWFVMYRGGTIVTGSRLSLIAGLNLLIFGLLCVHPVQAAKPPSKKKVKKYLPYRDVIKCTYEGSGAYYKEKRDVEEAEASYVLTETFWHRKLRCSRYGGVSGKKKIKRISKGMIAVKVDNRRRFTFHEWDHETTYQGIPAPRGKEVIALAQAGWGEVLGRRTAAQVTKIYAIKIAPKQSLTWPSLNQLEIEIEMVLDLKTEAGLDKVKKRLKIKLERKSFKAAWRLAEGAGTPTKADEVLAETELTPEARADLKPIYAAHMDAKAKTNLAVLPTVKIPELKSEKQAIALTFRMLREATPKKLEAFLRQVLSSFHRVAGSEVRLNPRAEELIAKTVAAAYGMNTNAREQYCAEPRADENDGRKFWNAWHTTFSRVTFIKETGGFMADEKSKTGFRLSDIDLQLTTGDELLEWRGYQLDFCSSVRRSKGRGRWRPGVQVSARNVDGTWWLATLLGFKDKTFLIRHTDGTLEEVTEDRLQFFVKQHEPTTGIQKPTGGDWKPGDRCEVNWRNTGKWYPATVMDVNTATVRIFLAYDDGSEEWVESSLLRELIDEEAE